MKHWKISGHDVNIKIRIITSTSIYAAEKHMTKYRALAQTRKNIIKRFPSVKNTTNLLSVMVLI